MEITLREAAQRLEISVRQAQRLVHKGRLQVVRQVGRSLLVDDSGISAIAQGRRTAGRRWSPTTCWAAIEILDTGDTNRLSSSSSKSRLRARLGTVCADEFVRLTADRARVMRMTQTLGTRHDLASALMPGGHTALQDAVASEALGLTSGQRDIVDGYASEEVAGELVDWFGLEPSGEGNVFLSITSEQPVRSMVVVALDLVERGSTRERSAAFGYLTRALGSYAFSRAGRGRPGSAGS